MLRPTTLYKHAKNFMNPKGSKPIYNHIYFDGEKAYVTDGHTLVIAKDYPAAEKHFEDARGNLVASEEMREVPNFEKVLTKEENVIWKYKNPTIRDMKKFVKPFEAAFDFFKKINRDSPVMMLEYQDGVLRTYAVNEDMRTTIEFGLTRSDMEGENWTAGFNYVTLLNVMKLIKDTDYGYLYINKARMHVLTFETRDLLITMTGLSDNNDYLRPIKAYMKPQDDFSFDE